MRVSLLVVLLGAGLANGVQAAPQRQCLAIENAFAANDVEALAALQPSAPRWQAQQMFRLAAAHIPAARRGDARRAIRAGLAVVAERLQQQPDDIEVLLLGAMLDGQYLLLDRWRLAFNGWRGLRRLARAEALAPANPRIALIRGTAKVILPKVLGGGAGEAISLFNEALDAPVAARPDTEAEVAFIELTLCENGQWAQVDLLNWLGRAYAKLDDQQRSKQAYQRALQRSPDNYWVRLAIDGLGYEWRNGSGHSE